MKLLMFFVFGSLNCLAAGNYLKSGYPVWAVVAGVIGVALLIMAANEFLDWHGSKNR